MSDQHDSHETVVVKEGGGSGMTAIVAILVIVLLAAGAWYFLLGPGANTDSTPTDVDVNIEMPSVAPVAS